LFIWIFREAPVSFVADHPPIMEESDEENEMISGQGRVVTPVKVRKEREKERQQTPDVKKVKFGKMSIKEQTEYQLKDPSTYYGNNLKVKNNRDIFKRMRTPEELRVTPEGMFRMKCFWNRSSIS